jgi:hypothetical protein
MRLSVLGDVLFPIVLPSPVRPPAPLPLVRVHLAVHLLTLQARTLHGCRRASAGSSRRLSAATAAEGGERKQMNMFTAINDALRVAMETDPTAVRVLHPLFVCQKPCGNATTTA